MSVVHECEYDEADVALLPQKLFKKRLFGTTKLYGKTLNDSPLMTPVPYEMENRKRGFAVIIDNNHDDASTPTNGKYSMQALLEWLGFEVHIWTNCSASSIRDIMYIASGWNHRYCDAFVCVVSSRISASSVDNTDVFQTGDDDSISIETLTLSFQEETCQTLSGKPKMFYLMQTVVNDMTDDQDEEEVCLSFREENIDDDGLMSLSSDFIIVMTQETIDPSFMYSDETNAATSCPSKFETCLSNALRKTRIYEDIDLVTHLGVVNRQISTCVHTPSKPPCPQTLHAKPVLCYLSTLTKRLYLRPKS